MVGTVGGACQRIGLERKLTISPQFESQGTGVISPHPETVDEPSEPRRPVTQYGVRVGSGIGEMSLTRPGRMGCTRLRCNGAGVTAYRWVRAVAFRGCQVRVKQRGRGTGGLRGTAELRGWFCQRDMPGG